MYKWAQISKLLFGYKKKMFIDNIVNNKFLKFSLYFINSIIFSITLRKLKFREFQNSIVTISLRQALCYGRDLTYRY